VLSVTGSVGNGFIVRTAPENADAVYVAQKEGKTIYFTRDAGEEKWFTRTCKYDVQDLAVESEDVAYVGVNDSVLVSKTTNGGFIWGTGKDSELAGGFINTIVSLGEDKVIVGSDEGYVSYSTDGNSNWTKIIKQAESGALKTQVAASGLDTDAYIYVATSENTTHVVRWQIGTSTAWTDLVAPVSTDYKATGIVLEDGILYVATENATDSEVLVTKEPTSGTPKSSRWSTTSSAGEVFNATPSSLKVSTGSIKLWAVDTYSTDELFYFTDILSQAGPTLISPADGKKIAVNPVTGKSYDVTFNWNQPDKARYYYYRLVIAYDSGFLETAKAISDIYLDSSQPSYTVGSSTFEFMPGTTYYWHVQVQEDGPVETPYSEGRSFSIEPGVAAVPKILAPENGAVGVSKTPSFSWDPVSGATQYQFVLADNVYLKAPIIDKTVAGTGYAIARELREGLTYYWSVKALAPVEGDMSAIANFTVKEAPAPAPAPTPPVVVKEMPAPQITVQTPPPPPDIVIPPAPTPPAPIAPAYIWAIIIIGAVLVIAVIVLIVRTRRTV
jgi:photosystem II stability/assembly factor-like uncharacterized protein